MPTLPARPSSSAPLLLAALLSACPGGGDDTSSGGSSTGSTAAAESSSGAPDDTTGAPPTTGTGEPETTTVPDTTTGVVLDCDGETRDNVFECMACTECGTWTDPPPDGSYPEAMRCMLEGLRDGAVVGATTESCNQGICLNSRLITTGEGTLISQADIYNQNEGTHDYQGMQELEVRDAAFFEACLAAYDPNCAVSNAWFAGAATDLTMVTCP